MLRDAPTGTAMPNAADPTPSPDIIALGEPMLEFNQARADAPDAYLRGFGGDTSNMAIAASRLLGGSGRRVGYVTRVGDDPFGRMLLDLWRREGVDTRGVAVDPVAATGVYFVTHGPKGHEFSYLRAGSAASRMRPETLPLDTIRGTRILHVSGISQAISADACDAVFAAVDAVKSAGGVLSYDPNLRLKLWPLARARAIVLATIPHCDWFLPGLEEVTLLSGLTDVAAVVDWCHARGAPVVVMKCGAEGVVVSDGRRREHIPGLAVQSVDATGAGDCFDGAYAARVLCGDDPFAAARYANAAAALATTGFGAVAPLPRDAEVRGMLASAR
jgi:2-dehydro-3-deoxygluconokinase